MDDEDLIDGGKEATVAHKQNDTPYPNKAGGKEMTQGQLAKERCKQLGLKVVGNKSKNETWINVLRE